MSRKVNENESDSRTHIIIVPSTTYEQEDIEDAIETEITAVITMPQEGGWGWVVVLGSFWSLFVLDGVSQTFGSMYKDMSIDLQRPKSLVVLLNSIAVALYFVCGPLASALINRFGFRASVMLGSITCSLSLFCTYFCTHYALLCLFYGVCAGFGYCLINLSASVIVGFYFAKLRSLALAIANTGSSIGITIMFPVNSYIVQYAGWRVLTLFHSGLFGIVFFLGMTYKPLVPLTVTKTSDDPTKTVTFLPNLSTAVQRISDAKSKGLIPSRTERLFSAISNTKFPTVAGIFTEERRPSEAPGPSVPNVQGITIVPPPDLTYTQLKQVELLNCSKQSLNTHRISVQIPVVKKTKWWKRCVNWEKRSLHSRPLYKDDVFYNGNIEHLPVYEKHVVNIPEEQRTGFEYQLAVSRTIRKNELEDRRICSIAVRRILATMMDPSLFRKRSFNILCISGLLNFVGFYIPYVFVQERNLKNGVEIEHCSFIVSVIGFGNVAGKPIIGALACKVDPFCLYILTNVISGVAIIVSNFYFNAYFQYFIWFVFGFFIDNLSNLRSIIIVNLYGLDNLTNATGLILLFQGVGSLISTPLSSEIESNFGFNVAFYCAGSVIVISGLLLIIIKVMKYLNFFQSFY